MSRVCGIYIKLTFGSDARQTGGVSMDGPNTGMEMATFSCSTMVYMFVTELQSIFIYFRYLVPYQVPESSDLKLQLVPLIEFKLNIDRINIEKT